MKKTNKKLDVEMYTPYLGGDLDVEEIERLFQEKDQMEQKGVDPASANIQLLQANATPQNLPFDVFMQLGESDDDDEEDIYNFGDETFFDEPDFDDFLVDESELEKNPKQLIYPYVRQVKIGSCFELWPKKRLAHVLPFDPYLHPITDFPNVQPVIKDDQFYAQMKETKYIKLDHLTVDSVLPYIPNNTDAIVLDPPFAQNPQNNSTKFKDNNSEWDFHTLSSFFISLREKTEFCFVLIWVDPETMNTIVSAADYAQFIYADSCVVELFEGNLKPAQIYSEFGLMRQSRMILIYRTGEATREMFAKQKNRDATWGIISHEGKSQGRLGMPPIAHSIVEGLLPSEGKERIFIELWPTRFQPHPKWILIDENDPPYFRHK